MNSGRSLFFTGSAFSLILALTVVFPKSLSAKPHLRLDDPATVTPISAVLLLIDPATGKDKELLKLNAQTLGVPVIVGDTLFVTSSARTLYALDAQSGQKKWEYKSDQHLFGLTATPKTVFVGAGVMLNALDPATGKLLWSFESDIPVIDPVLADGVIVFNALDGPVAVDQKEGTQRWRVEVRWGYLVFSPLPDHRLCVWRPDEIHIVDTESGKALWQTTGEIGATAPGALPQRAVAAGNSVFQLRGSSKDAQDWSLHALDAGSGNPLWTTALGEHKALATQILVSGDSVFCVVEEGLHCLDSNTGKLRWETKTRPLEAGGAPMLADKQSLYIPELGGDLAAVDFKTGQLRWRNSAPEPSPKGTIRFGGAVVSPSAVYVTRNELARS